MAFEFDNALTDAKDVNMHTHILCVMNGEPAEIESFLKDMETYGIEECGMDARPKMGGTSNGKYFGFWYEIVSTIRKIRNSTVAYFTVPPLLCHYTKLPREGYQPGWRYVQYYLKLIYVEIRLHHGRFVCFLSSSHKYIKIIFLMLRNDRCGGNWVT